MKKFQHLKEFLRITTRYDTIFAAALYFAVAIPALR
jgi:hypothetical protein